jgi:hypothetical protein
MSGRDRIALAMAASLALGGSALLVGSAYSADAAAPAGAQSPATTPRTADGHPDLMGFWSPGPPMELAGLFGPSANAQSGDRVLEVNLRYGDIANLTNDNVIGRRAPDNLPLYKPEYWDIVLENDLEGNQRDPFNSCLPIGLPRLGPPARIIQTATELVLQYTVPFQRNEIRIVPIGPRSHKVDHDGTWFGDPVANWDGDTLVIETIGFNDQTWIGPEGYIHGYELKVTERLRREGDALHYDVVTEDPEFLQKPWVQPTTRLNLVRRPGYRIEESPPCSERDNEHIVAKNREL